MNKYVKLYQETETEHFPKAVEIIKNILIENKSKKYAWLKTSNQINELFLKTQKSNLIYNPKLAVLQKAYTNGLLNYEQGYSLLAIPNELLSEFKKNASIKISFEEYIHHLAIESAFSKIHLLFDNSRSYELMYAIGRFEGYEHFGTFDVENILEKSNSNNLYSELYNIVYPKKEEASENLNQKNDLNIRYVKIFDFRKDYLRHVKSKEFFSDLVGDYFNDYQTNYEDFENVFFKDPKFHNSKIHLDCDTTLFALLLNQLQEQKIANKINYTEIGKHNLFLTKNDRNLSRGSISNLIRTSSEAHRQIVNSTIKSIKENIKC